MSQEMFFLVHSAERREDAAAFVARLDLSPLMQVDIRPYKKDRSKRQNRTYWMWLNAIAEHNGNTSEELHEEMKVRVLGVEHRVVAGQHIIMPTSSASLSTKEFGELMRAVEVLAGELGVALPYPDDYRYIMNAE